MPEPKVRRSVDFPHALYERLLAAAQARKEPVNAVVVQAVEQWLARHDQQAKGAKPGGGASKA